MKRFERHIRFRLDDLTPWIVIAYFGLTFVLIGTIIALQTTQKTQLRQSRDEAIRSSEIQANIQSQFSQCIHSRPVFARTNRFIRGIKTMEMVLLTNSAATLEATPTGDPDYPVRVRNLLRLRKVALAPAVHFPVPTVAECEALKTSGRKP